MNKPPLIFLHAHQNDLALARELESLLTPLQSQGLVRLYGAHHIPAGANTRVEMDRHINEARLILPLVSADLLASEPAMELIQRALARQASGPTSVVPVLLRSSLWQFSSLRPDSKPLPSDGRAITSWPTRQAAWDDVLQGLLKLLNLLAASPAPDAAALLENAGKGSPAPPPAKGSTALLLVAVSNESKALLAELRQQSIESKEEKLGTRYVDTFPLLGRDRSWRVVVGQSVEKGPHAAQALVQDLVRETQPEVVLLVGMCGGLSERGAKDNTVLVARQVLNYEPARLRDGKATLASTTYRAGATVTDLVNRLIARDAFPDIDLVAGKDYASGEKLIDDLDAALRSHLMELSGDLIGFEMEGHGMLHTLWELQRDGRALQAAMIKGVSDFGDGRMREGKEVRQIAATRRAVRVALEVLRRY